MGHLEDVPISMTTPLEPAGSGGGTGSEDESGRTAYAELRRLDQLTDADQEEISRFRTYMAATPASRLLAWRQTRRARFAAPG